MVVVRSRHDFRHRDRAESENRSFQFGNFEVIAVQDALSAMRFELFPGMPEEEFLRLTGGGRVPSSVNVFPLLFLILALNL